MSGLVPTLRMACSPAARSGLLDVKGKVRRSVCPHTPVSIIKLRGPSHFGFADPAWIPVAAVEITVAAVSSASFATCKTYLSLSGQGLLV